jgi:hypothetical protein
VVAPPGLDRTTAVGVADVGRGTGREVADEVVCDERVDPLDVDPVWRGSDVVVYGGETSDVAGGVGTPRGTAQPAPSATTMAAA